MATSSITKNFFIRGKEQVSTFINLLESEPVPTQPSNTEFVTNSEKVRQIFDAWENNVNKIKTHGHF